MSGVRCENCGGAVNTNSSGWAQRVEGWEVRRHQGGTNAIMEPRRLQRFLCNMCVVRMKTVKQPAGQGTLL